MHIPAFLIAVLLLTGWSAANLEIDLEDYEIGSSGIGVCICSNYYNYTIKMVI